MKSSEKSQSFDFVDVLRGLAALLVAYFHLHLHIYEHYPEVPVVKYSFTYFFIYGIIDLGKFAVGIFFIISGFLIPSTLSRPTSSLRSYGIHRFFRLYPAYWLSIAVWILATILQGGGKGLNFRQIAINVTMFQGFLHVPDVVGAFWTLQIEICFYLICAVLFITKLLPKRRLIIAGAATLAMLTAIGRHVMHRDLPVAIFIALMLMFLGDSLRANLRGDVSDQETRQNFVGVALLLIPICLVGYGDDGLRYLVTYWAALAVFQIVLHYRSIFEGNNALLRVLKALGAVSYSFYVLHAPIGLTLGTMVMASTHSRLLAFLAVFASTTPAAFLSYYVLELPCIRLGKRLTAAAPRPSER